MQRQAADRELVHRILGGETEAFAALVEAYQEPVWFLVRRIVGNDAEARETVQDVFVKVYRQLHRFDGRSAFATWLYRIACNTAISAVRRRRLPAARISDRMLATIPDEAVDALFAAEANERRIARLHRAIGQLEPAEQALVTLFYFEEQSVADCAAIFGITENLAKVRLHRIRKKLYALMKEENDER